MKRAPGKLNSIWPSQVAEMEAWSSAWLDAPQPRHAHDLFQVSLTRHGAGQVRRASENVTPTARRDGP